MQRQAGKQGRSHGKSKAEVRVLLFCYIPRSVKDCQESLVARKRPGRIKDSSRELSEGVWPCQYLGFILQVLRTVEG